MNSVVQSFRDWIFWPFSYQRHLPGHDWTM